MSHVRAGILPGKGLRTIEGYHCTHFNPLYYIITEGGGRNDSSNNYVIYMGVDFAFLS